MTKENIERAIERKIESDHIEGLKSQLCSIAQDSFEEVVTIKQIEVVLNNFIGYTGKGKYEFSGRCVVVAQKDENGYTEQRYKLKGIAFVEEGEDSPIVIICQQSISL